MIRKRFPLVMMLEPLHACNLTCTGCGRIREYESTITERVPLEECLAAVDECGAPMVSICGGEPMMYPQIGEAGGRHPGAQPNIYLCTNGMFIKKRLREFTPDKRFFFNVHLDGHGEDPRHLRGARRRFPRSHRGHQSRQGRRFPGLHQHHGLQRNRHGRSRSCSSTWSNSTWTATRSRRPTDIRPSTIAKSS
jgi:hypothetical protein